MNKVTRREMIASLGVATSVAALGPRASTAAPDPEGYMLDSGLTYLNTGSLGPCSRLVMGAVMKAWSELELNPVANAYGGVTHEHADKTRNAVAALIGCSADEILLTRSTTNAINIAALGMDLVPGDRVLTTDVEHEGGSAAWKYLEKRRGIVVDRVAIAPEDHDIKGIIERFDRAMTKRTKVVSLSHIITSTGLKMPVNEIVGLAKSRNILTIVDGAQAVGNTEVDVQKIGCDAYAAPGHKWLLGPKGTGFLYIRKGRASRIEPIEWSDGTKFVVGSAGMGSLPLVVGLGAAIDAAQKRGVAASEARNLRLRNRAYDGLKKITAVKVVSAPPGPLATALVAFRLPDSKDSSEFRTTMRQKHRIILKQTEKRWFNGMRISPHVFNTEADIDAALKAIAIELG